MKNETLLKKFEAAVVKLCYDEQAEHADPNRESADYARETCRKLRKEVLERMDKHDKKVQEVLDIMKKEPLPETFPAEFSKWVSALISREQKALKSESEPPLPDWVYDFDGDPRTLQLGDLVEEE